MNTEERARERALREEQAEAHAQSAASSAADASSAKAPTSPSAQAAFARDAAAAVASPSSPSRRKIALALGSRDANDTALLCAYAARKILVPDDHLTVLHVSEAPTPTWVRHSRACMCACRCACARGAARCRPAGVRCCVRAPRVLFAMRVMDARACHMRAQVTRGEKRATEWSAEQLPAWVPDSLASLLRKWPDASRVTAAELDAGAVAPADAVIDFCASELRPDILMLGSRPRGMLQRAFVSSVSSYVVRARRAARA
jgi:hypothetical protein